MGYSTTFTGSLSFKTEPTASQLAKLNAMFGEDCRDHPEWGAPGLYHIDLELSKDFKSVSHDGSEKTYELDKLVNVVLKEMRKTWPDFGLVGQMMAQGEDVEDRWQLVINDHGWAERRDVALVGTRVVCPHCEQKFVLEES